MEVREILAHFFGGDEHDCGRPDLKELKKEYLKEIKSVGCSGCHARRIRSKYESLVIKKINTSE
jgi:hypothetical protein|tara:strand:- start:1416 stop:1607 length:192 start_codon:yes stop_codon:yes gene_type:complete